MDSLKFIVKVITSIKLTSQIFLSFRIVNTSSHLIGELVNLFSAPLLFVSFQVDMFH